MPDKKLTDNEIKKALECFAIDKDFDENYCKGCVFDTKGICYQNCSEELAKYALDLINRLQAENERLKPFEDKIAEFNSHIRVENMLVFASSLEEWLEFCDSLKAEAYKEFAELLHCQCESIINQPHNENVRPISWKVAYEEFDEKVDSLLKELVGEDNG